MFACVPGSPICFGSTPGFVFASIAIFIAGIVMVGMIGATPRTVSERRVRTLGYAMLLIPAGALVIGFVLVLLSPLFFIGL
jgi:hypothetical protein